MDIVKNPMKKKLKISDYYIYNLNVTIRIYK